MALPVLQYSRSNFPSLHLHPVHHPSIPSTGIPLLRTAVTRALTAVAHFQCCVLVLYCAADRTPDRVLSGTRNAAVPPTHKDCPLLPLHARSMSPHSNHHGVLWKNPRSDGAIIYIFKICTTFGPSTVEIVRYIRCAPERPVRTSAHTEHASLFYPSTSDHSLSFRPFPHAKTVPPATLLTSNPLHYAVSEAQLPLMGNTTLG